MATRSIVTYQPDVECDVCGRRLLRGERPDVFLAAGHERTVCELCMPRATQEGWRRASEVPEAGIGSQRPRRGISLIGRLRQLRAPDARLRSGREEDGRGGLAYEGEDDRDREALAPDLDDPEESEDPIGGIGAASSASRVAGATLGRIDGTLAAGRGVQRRSAWPEAAGGQSQSGHGSPREPAARQADLAHPLAGSAAPEMAGAADLQTHGLEQHGDSRLDVAESDALQRMQGALAIFNASEYTQRVAGISRSLGEPSVTVRALDGSQTVAILVAWELAWYRYGVDLSAPQAAVQLLADGTELHELPEEDRLPNALAGDRGELSLLL